jgi:hypothetical protein
MGATEKRKSVRVPVDFPASFSYGSRNHTGTVLNLSVDGALLHSDQLVDVGRSIKLQFALPDHELRTKAQIVWGKSIDQSTFGMGLFFEDLPALHQAAIDLFIRNLLKI